jgi:hypothetical protein
MGEPREDELDDFRMDRTQESVAPMTDRRAAVKYWLSRPVEERLQELERLRRICYGEAACSGPLQRVFEVVRPDLP